MRVAFMGTPAFAVGTLRALQEAGHDLCAAFSQPDRPVGRHQNTFQPTPVKEYALSHQIPVYQPEKLRDGQALAILRDLAPDLIVVAAYGRILPDEILALPPLGCINVHASLLPKFRGAAPINWAILTGERETGVTIMHMAHDLDAGDVILARATPIHPDEAAPELYDRLARMGGELAVEAVAAIAAGTARRTPQDPALATLAPMLSRELSPMDWSRSAWELHCQVRGLAPWPCAVTQLDGVRCKVWKSALTGESTRRAPGSVVQADKRGLKLACGDGQVLALLELQPDGKKAMSAAAFLQGHPLSLGETGDGA